MKIAFFSDIHGNKYTLSKFFDYTNEKSIDKIIFCGDIFGYYYYQDEIIDMFREKHNLEAVLGNHDKIFLDIIGHKKKEIDYVKKYGNTYKNSKDKIKDINIQYLKGLPESLTVEIGDIKIGVFHGSPENYLEGRIYPDTCICNVEKYTSYDYLVLGHTHHKMVRKIDKTLIINPGSLGQQRDGKGCSFIVLDTETGNVEFNVVDYNVGQLVADIDKYDQGNKKLVEVLLRSKRL